MKSSHPDNRRHLHILAALDVGGIERHVLDRVCRQRRQGIESDFLLLGMRRGPLCDEAERMGCRIHNIPSRRSPLAYHRGLRKFFSGHKGVYSTVTLSGTSLTTVAPLAEARRAGIPERIIHIHNTSCRGLHNRILHMLNRLRIASLATCWHACSEEARIWGYAGSGVLHKARVVANAVSASRFRFNPQRRQLTRERLGLAHNMVIGHIGRFSPEKNHRRLLRIFRHLSGMQPSARLLLVGGGPLEEEVKEMARCLGIADKVVHAGLVPDPESMLDAMDCLVMPSHFEGLPYVMVEAQVSGLPAVVSDSIRPEADVGGDVTFLSLADPDSLWTETIADRAGKTRPDRADAYRSLDARYLL